MFAHIDPRDNTKILISNERPVKDLDVIACGNILGSISIQESRNPNFLSLRDQEYIEFEISVQSKGNV